MPRYTSHERWNPPRLAIRSSKRSSRAILRPIVAWRDRPTGGVPVPLRRRPRTRATVRGGPGFWGTMDTDSPLIAALAEDVDGSFEALVLAHQDRLYSIALRLLGDPRDAEEAAQDAFVRAYRALSGYDAGTDPRAPAPAVAGHDRAQPVSLATDPAAGQRPPVRVARRPVAGRSRASRRTRRTDRSPRARPAPRRPTGPSCC